MAIKHEIRASKGNGETRQVELTPNKAIHYHCVECMGWSSHEVKDCSDPHCPLYPFRLGTNPSRKREQREPRKVRTKGAILS